MSRGSERGGPAREEMVMKSLALALIVVFNFSSAVLAAEPAPAATGAIRSTQVTPGGAAAGAAMPRMTEAEVAGALVVTVAVGAVVAAVVSLSKNSDATTSH